MVSITPTTTTSGCQLHADEPALCRYAGKRCFSPRTTKRNGSLHNLCHVHRVRANQNQRRMELKRRISRGQRQRGGAHRTLPRDANFVFVHLDARHGRHRRTPRLDLSASTANDTSQLNSIQQQQLLLPDYTLNAFVGSILADESLFVDLHNSDAFAKDSAAAHVSGMDIYLHEAASNDQAYMLPHQQQQPALEPAYLHQSQSDMWIVPNFLLTL